MSQYKLKQPPEKQIWEEGENTLPALFPDILDLSNLQIDNQLPAIIFNQNKDITKTEQNKIDISIKVPDLKKEIDLYLFINGVKRDVFYQVKSNSYTFKNVNLIHGINKLEFFYRLGKSKSSSVYYVIKGEGKKAKR